MPTIIKRALIAFATAAIPFSANANSLPSASWYINLGASGVPGPSDGCCSGPYKVYSSPGDRSFSNVDYYGSSSYANVKAFGTPYPALSVSLSAGPSARVSDADIAGGESQLDYYVGVNGPAGAYVPIDFIGTIVVNTNVVSGTMPAGGSTQGNASFAINYAVDDVQSVNDVTTVTTGIGSVHANTKPGSYTFQGTIDLYANTSFEVQMISGGNVESENGGGEATSNSYVDPYFYVDPTFVEASLYTVNTSDGIGNSLPSVPLPASAPMFGAALLALAAVGYAAQRKKATATT